MFGFVVIDKPIGPTSHDIVGILRAVTGVRKIGHTGTLDPFASGVLPVAIGGATRLIQFLDESEKVYEATLQLGAATTTGDPEGEVCERAPVPEAFALDEVLAALVGEQMQAPPAYSAVKVDGKALYQYAREGSPRKGAPRPIVIHGLEGERRGDQIHLRVRCGRGTYVRVLAEDIARGLGTVGHLTQLRRLASGPFGLDGAVSLDTLGEWSSGLDDWKAAFPKDRDARPERRPRSEVIERLQPHVVPVVEALALPVVVSGDPALHTRVRQGQSPRADLRQEEGRFVLVNTLGEATAVMEREQGRIRSLRVLPAAQSGT